jgi:hypothetical protein
MTTVKVEGYGTPSPDHPRRTAWTREDFAR